MIAALPLVSSVLGALAPSASTPTVKPPGTAPEGGFAEMVQKLAADTVGNLKAAEKVSVDGIQGKADLQSVVQSVMSAQLSLQTALAVRDKTVAALQEITRMSI